MINHICFYSCAILIGWVFYSIYPAAAESEKHYQQEWCDANSGKMEVVLKDRTRVDCLTDTHAVEVGFGAGWYGDLGQRLHYSRLTGKRAGIVMILKKKSDKKYLKALNAVLMERRIELDVWAVGDGVYD